MYCGKDIAPIPIWMNHIDYHRLYTPSSQLLQVTTSPNFCWMVAVAWFVCFFSQTTRFLRTLKGMIIPRWGMISINLLQFNELYPQFSLVLSPWNLLKSFEIFWNLLNGCRSASFELKLQKGPPGSEQLDWIHGKHGEIYPNATWPGHSNIAG